MYKDVLKKKTLSVQWFLHITTMLADAYTPTISHICRFVAPGLQKSDWRPGSSSATPWKRLCIYCAPKKLVLLIPSCYSLQISTIYLPQTFSEKRYRQWKIKFVKFTSKSRVVILQVNKLQHFVYLAGDGVWKTFKRNIVTMVF